MRSHGSRLDPEFTNKSGGVLYGVKQQSICQCDVPQGLHHSYFLFLGQYFFLISITKKTKLLPTKQSFSFVNNGPHKTREVRDYWVKSFDPSL